MNTAYIYTIASGLLMTLGKSLSGQPGWVGWIGQGVELVAPTLLGLAVAHGDAKAAAQPNPPAK